MVLAQRLCCSALSISAALAGYACGADAQTFAVLHSFAGAPYDGASPSSSLSIDEGDNIYGTTKFGGTKDKGTIFKLAPDGTETLLYSFTGGRDGAYPVDDKVILNGTTGDLYGIAEFGGDGKNCPAGCGVIWKLAPDLSFSVLHNFNDDDGSFPVGGPIRDVSGNLYGITQSGGDHSCAGGCGVVWKLAPNGSFSVLHAFTGEATGDGAYPIGRLARDQMGNLYGATSFGGQYGQLGYGTIYKVTSGGAETLLHVFSLGDDGTNPSSGVRRSRAGYLYGTTFQQNHNATVFGLGPDGTLTTLYDFGGHPTGDLLRTHSGRLYGTDGSGGVYSEGSLFELKPDGTYELIHSFDSSDGANPEAGLVKGKHSFYGTAEEGGASGNGVVFSLTNR